MGMKGTLGKDEWMITNKTKNNEADKNTSFQLLAI
jgi:hypothetical protein